MVIDLPRSAVRGSTRRDPCWHVKQLQPDTTRRARASEPGVDLLAPILGEVAALPPLLDDLEHVEQRLDGLLQSSISRIPRLERPRGPRLHPLVTLLVAQAAGYHEVHRITVAAIGELLYAQSVLHEDVCDRGEFRRGRPVARLGHGNGLAVLVGDFCYARALQAMAEIGDASALCGLADLVVRRSEAGAARLHGSGACDLDREQHSQIIAARTAALLAWCGTVGLLLPPRPAAALGTYAEALGFALQIVEDIRDCALDLPRSQGHAGQELREGRPTLPVILAWERSPGLRGEVQELLRGGAPVDDARLHCVLEWVARSGGLDAARALAMEHVATAQAALSALSPSPARTALVALAYAVVDPVR